VFQPRSRCSSPRCDGDVRRRLSCGLCPQQAGSNRITGARARMPDRGSAGPSLRRPDDMVCSSWLPGGVSAPSGTRSPMLAATLGGLPATWVPSLPAFSGFSSRTVRRTCAAQGLAGALTATPPRWSRDPQLRSGFALHTVFRRPRRCVRSGCRSTCLSVEASLFPALGVGRGAATAIFRFTWGC